MDTAYESGRMPELDPVRDGGLWIFPDGRILSVIAGAEDGAGDGGGDGDGGTGNGDGDGGQGDGGDGKPKVYDEGYVKGLRAEAKGHREEKERLAAKLREIEDRDKSDDEKRTESLTAAEKRATTAEERVAALEKEQMRMRVGLSKGLPPELVSRLRGDTEEEVEKDAEDLAKLAKRSAPADDLDGGARRGGEPDVDPGLPRLQRAYAQSGKKSGA